MRARCSVFPHHRRVPLVSRLISRMLVNSLQWVRNHKRGAAFQHFLGVDNYNVRFDTSPMKCAHPKMKAGCGCSLQGCTSLYIFWLELVTHQCERCQKRIKLHTSVTGQVHCGASSTRSMPVFLAQVI